jgi:hypothetical protein
MMTFYGDKIRPRQNIKVVNKTFSWLFDTGAAGTCMNKQSFDMAFSDKRPRKISKAQSCVATSRGTMSLLSIFEINIWDNGKKFTHPVNSMTIKFA